MPVASGPDDSARCKRACQRTSPRSGGLGGLAFRPIAAFLLAAKLLGSLLVYLNDFGFSILVNLAALLFGRVVPFVLSAKSVGLGPFAILHIEGGWGLTVKA